jgi:hypothetical protein
MVDAVRAGESQRAVARRFKCGIGTVQRALSRAGHEPLEAVDWLDRPRIARRIARTDVEIEDLILDLRRLLRDESILGEYGPAAIRRELQARCGGRTTVPSLRTIARILERRGALDARRRVRRPAPPPGWHLPDVRAGRAELDSFDVIEGLRLKGGIDLDILTGISLHGGLAMAWPTLGVSARLVVGALEEHWRAVGRPGYAQFDNDTRFIGGMSQPNSIGPVIRFCLAVDVVPVFVPPRETGFQASVEAFNGRWQRKLWARFWDPTVDDLRARSAVFIRASRNRAAARIDAAPDRAPFPVDPIIDLAAPPSGRLIFIRRTTDQGEAAILGLRYRVDRHWIQRLVRGELDLDERRLRFFALRRREPDAQPLLGEVAFEPPARWYR